MPQHPVESLPNMTVPSYGALTKKAQHGDASMDASVIAAALLAVAEQIRGLREDMKGV
jgi:hypothetical protein